jgi:hypothetical protein
MRNQIAPNVSLAIALSTAAATVALRAAARRRESRPVPSTEPAPVTATADECRPLTTGVIEQTQHVFHELHADGHNPLCAVCDNKYGLA